MHEPPTRVILRAPSDLIAQQIRHRHPKKTRNDKQVRKDSDKQPARFVAKKCGIEKRLGGEQAKNAKRAHSQKFLHKAQDEHITNRQSDEQRPAKTGELAHFHRAEKPKTPDKIDSQQDDAGKKGGGEVSSQALHQRRPEQPRQSDQKKKRAGDESGSL